MISFKRFFTPFLILSIVFGFILVNFIDSVGPNPASHMAEYYHVWLIVTYFMPFIVIAVIKPEDWELPIAFGFLASLMNDGLWGFWQILIKGYTLEQFSWWAYNWYVPSQEVLFTLSFGLPVYGWMMALSIYVRMIITVFLIRKWWMEPD